MEILLFLGLAILVLGTTTAAAIWLTKGSRHNPETYSRRQQNDREHNDKPV
jgi:hypothetical protein